MYELYGFTAVRGPFKGQRIAYKAGWRGNAYAGSAFTLDDDASIFDKVFKASKVENATTVERTPEGLFKYLKTIWGEQEL